MNPLNGILTVITGPTASGKTAHAVSLARTTGSEIISADSRQLYRGMDLGTGKDLEEYGDVPYHLIDICPAGHRYNLFEYLRDFAQARSEIEARGHSAVLCGGTGLYVESVVKGIALPPVPANPELRTSLEGKSLEELTLILQQYKTLHNTTDVDSCKRAIRAIEISEYYHRHPELKSLTEPQPLRNALIIGVSIDRDARRERITQRLKDRLDAGMADEIRCLIDSGIAPDDLIYYGLEYKWITRYVTGEITRREMFYGLETAIHQFAKRQMTWFRGMERRGFTIHWLPWDMPHEQFNTRVLELADELRHSLQNS